MVRGSMLKILQKPLRVRYSFWGLLGDLGTKPYPEWERDREIKRDHYVMFYSDLVLFIVSH